MRLGPKVGIGIAVLMLIAAAPSQTPRSIGPPTGVAGEKIEPKVAYTSGPVQEVSVISALTFSIPLQRFAVPPTTPFEPASRQPGGTTRRTPRLSRSALLLLHNMRVTSDGKIVRATLNSKQLAAMRIQV